jgi:hypothetical protein
MKWPRLVSYDVAQSCIAPWQAIVAEQSAMLQEYRTMYADLLERYHALKIVGAVVQPDYGYIEPPLTVDEEDAKKAQEDDDGN